LGEEPGDPATGQLLDGLSEAVLHRVLKSIPCAEDFLETARVDECPLGLGVDVLEFTRVQYLLFDRTDTS
jgi:hypothetical protein